MRRLTWQALFFAALTAPLSSPGAEELPHRRLATTYFPGPPELNAPEAALFASAAQRESFRRLTQLLSRRRQLPGGLSVKRLRELAEELALEDPELLQTALSLASRLRRTELPRTSFGAEVQDLVRFGETVQKAPWGKAVLRFALRSAARGAENPDAPGIVERLRQARELLREAGVPPSVLRRGTDLARNFVAKARDVTSELARFTRGSVAAAARFTFPSWLAPAGAFFLCLAMGLCWVLLRRGKHPPETLPPLPDLAAFEVGRVSFPDLLLSYYRRVLSEEGLPFRGRTLSELRAQLLRRRPLVARATAELNKAFYPAYYAGRSIPPEERRRLAELLGGLMQAGPLWRIKNHE